MINETDVVTCTSKQYALKLIEATDDLLRNTTYLDRYLILSEMKLDKSGIVKFTLDYRGMLIDCNWVNNHYVSIQRILDTTWRKVYEVNSRGDSKYSYFSAAEFAKGLKKLRKKHMLLVGIDPDYLAEKLSNEAQLEVGVLAEGNLLYIHKLDTNDDLEDDPCGCIEVGTDYVSSDIICYKLRPGRIVSFGKVRKTSKIILCSSVCKSYGAIMSAVSDIVGID